MKRVLLIKMSSLGDVVHALPAVTDAVAQGYQIDWVVEEAFADIPSLHPGVNQVIPIAWRRWRRSLGANGAEMRAFSRHLRQDTYDLVLDSQGLLKSAAVGLLAGTPRAGYSHTSAREPWAAFSYGGRYRIPRRQHAIDRQRQLFAAALNYEVPDTFATGIESHSAVNQQVLLLHGTTWQTKHWPVQMWQALVEQITGSGFEPVVTWGNDAEKERAQLLTAAGARMLDRTSLVELAGHMRSMSAVIGVDSGISHLSAALGVPTIGLYGPTDAQLTGSRGQCAINLQGETHCAPCLRKTCRQYRGPALQWQDQDVQPPCFAALTPDRVWARCRALLTGARARPVMGQT